MFLEKIDFHEFIESIVEILETKDAYTRGHSNRVAHISMAIAREMGLDTKDIELSHFAGHLHDIGKIGIPDSILMKTDKLTTEEYEIIKNHSEYGYKILEKVSSLKEMATIVRHHHERWDGKGYPSGISGEEKHIFGRITAIADVFDALGSNRIYKKAWSLERILELFKEQRGKHFDPTLVDIFLNNLDEFLEIRDKYKD